jgi:predicted SprT family Zn-dependent metalloprotease
MTGMKKTKSFFDLTKKEQKQIVESAAKVSNDAQRDLMEEYACTVCGAVPGQAHKDFCKHYICKHCGGDIRIRNPKGFCDHLYYPENCTVCRRTIRQTH